MNGRVPRTIESAIAYNLFPTELASPVRNSILFMTSGGPLSEPSGPNGTYDIYEAVRGSSGWETVRRVSPSGEQAVFPNAGGVSSDHWYDLTNAVKIQEGSGGSLSEEGVSNYLGNPDGSFELVGMGSLGTERFAQGRFIGPGGEHIIFTTGTGGWCSLSEPCPINQLEPNAPPSGTAAVYDRSPDGPTRVVSLLPGNQTPQAEENAEYAGSSDNGDVIAFKIAGKLYVRVGNARTEEVTADFSAFAGISQDGRRVLYLRDGNIFTFDVGSEVTSQANSSEDAEVVNVSADGSHVYFVSRSQLVGSSGAIGEPNLYLWTPADDATEFIATLSPQDVEGLPSLTSWVSWVVDPENSSHGPGADPSRTTPGGDILVFESRAQLTGYPTEGHITIYRYDADAQTIACVSCNFAATQSTADARLENAFEMGFPIVIHNLSNDGHLVFFETPEALASADTDEGNDIYEWSSDADGPTLISSGQTAASLVGDNTIFGVTPTGSDVIFRTKDALLSAAAPGAPALYDARVGGGFPSAPSFQECAGSDCQERPAAGAPDLSSPKSSTFWGRGNVGRARHRCGRRQGNKHHRRNCRGKHRKKQRHQSGRVSRGTK